jgi:hypothetical protein
MMTERPDLLVRGDAPATGASAWQMWTERAREWFGRMLNALGVPGFVREVQVYDRLTNSHVTVKTSGFFTVVSVNGTDYYFKRLTGEFDGSGFVPECGQPMR